MAQRRYLQLASFISTWTAVCSLMVNISVNTSVYENTKVNIHCTVLGLQKNSNDFVVIQQYSYAGLTTEWLRNGTLLVSSQAEGNPVSRSTSIKDGVSYTLTFGAISRVNAGVWSCNVIRPAPNQMNWRIPPGGSQNTNVTVLYFPAAEPNCSQDTSHELIVGSRLLLHCQSEQAVPDVSLYWTQGDLYHPVKTKTIDRMVVNTLDIEVTSDLDGALFLCNLESPAFPGSNKNCSIGPLRVVNKEPEEHQQNVAVIVVPVVTSIFVFVIIVVVVVFVCKRTIWHPKTPQGEDPDQNQQGEDPNHNTVITVSNQQSDSDSLYVIPHLRGSQQHQHSNNNTHDAERTERPARSKSRRMFSNILYFNKGSTLIVDGKPDLSFCV